MSSDKNEDPGTKAIQNNPCGMCRAMGMPVCKGHGGGAGGGDDEAAATETDNATTEHTQDMIAQPLTKHFLDSELWQHDVHADDDIYTYQAAHTLCSIELDLNAGTLVFTAHPNLSRNEQKVLNNLYDALESELNAFKAELIANKSPLTDAMKCERHSNGFTIKLPTPEYFDTFIQRLIDKNLLHTQPAQKQHSAAAEPLKQQENNPQEPSETTTTPNPFDISKGPQPED